MKKLVLSNIQSGVRKLGAVKATLEHIQEAYTEAIASMLTAFVAGSSAPVIIHGCVNSGSGSTYNISAGAIYHSGEVFQIDAFAGTAGGADVPVLSLVTTWRAGDPVKYSDGSTHNTHEVRKYQWAFGASGSGLADFSAVVTLKTRIFNEYLDIDGSLAALVDAAPGTLDTLNELAAALADDPNFATTMTNALAARVLKAGDTMSGALQLDAGVRFKSAGPQFFKQTFDIGDWNMNIDISKGIDLTGSGITNDKITDVQVIIFGDPNIVDSTVTRNSLFHLSGGSVPGSWSANSGTPNSISLWRVTAGFYDSPDFEDTGYNRGRVTIEYTS